MGEINVGLIGFGTIGSGVADVLLKRRAYLKAKTGLDLNLKKICDKDISTDRKITLDKGLLTRDASSILDDPEIDVVIELIGGINPAKTIIKKALAHGKYVITANKALLCEEGEELFAFANAQNRCIRFEGAVGGGIPIVKALRRSLAVNNVQAIYGIVNGTSNYILWRMQIDGCDFKKALSDAKKLGFAEKNATLDVDGTDSAHKLALLALLGFGKSVSLDDIFVEGITAIEPCDIQFAKDLGYCIKLLAITKRHKDEIELRVHPTLLAADHPLSSVASVYNAIYVKGDLVGESLFYGKGAGKLPTASAVLADIIDVARIIERGQEECDCNIYFNSGIKKIRPVKDILSRYYVRFQAIDKPGVLAAVSDVLAGHDISIASVKQLERSSRKEVPIIMLTHEAQEKSMAAALKKINLLKCIKRKSVAIRIEKL